MENFDIIDFFLTLLFGVFVVLYFLTFVGNVQTSYIDCEDYQCTAVTKILFVNSTPLKTFNQVDVDDVVVTIEEKEESSKRPAPDRLSITVVHKNRTTQKIATYTDEEQILSAANDLRSFLENPDGAELSITLGPTAYDKYRFFLGLLFLTLFFVPLVILRVVGPL